jgi:hypothetical protein
VAFGNNHCSVLTGLFGSLGGVGHRPASSRRVGHVCGACGIPFSNRSNPFGVLRSRMLNWLGTASGGGSAGGNTQGRACMTTGCAAAPLHMPKFWLT